MLLSFRIFLTFCDVLIIFTLSKREKVNKKMSCNIAISQEPSLPASDRFAPETKVKDQKRVKAVRRSREQYMKKLNERVLKRN